jgi:hypothetical protein
MNRGRFALGSDGSGNLLLARSFLTDNSETNFS